MSHQGLAEMDGFVARQRFFFNLGALGAAFVLIVASVAFGPGAVKGVGLGIGIGCCVISLSYVTAGLHHRRFEGHFEVRVFGHVVGIWSMLAGVMATVAIWEIVGASVFVPDVSKWLTLANGVVIASLACAGLVMHEICTERVVHVLEIIERPDREVG